MKNIFLVSDTAQPSPRWLKAFPDGMLSPVNTLLATRAHADVAWLVTTAPAWETLIAELRRHVPRSAVVILSNNPGESEALTALAAGARGYCHAYAPSAQLREVAEVVGHGGYWLGPELLARLVGILGKHLPADPEALPDVLTVREAEVARAVADGLTNKEIAARIHLTERTVKAHLAAIFAKLGVRDRLQLAVKLTTRHNGQ
jgi:DNA-binding NarL/FixJ family response regulator